MIKFIILIFLFFCPLWSDEFIVAAAANMQFPLKDINIEYAKEFGKSFKPIISSSGKLAAQIQNGAPFSVFLSADMEFPKSVFLSGYAVSNPVVYAKGTLVIWTMQNWKDNQILSAIKEGKVKSMAIANPDLAPYGKESVRFLKNLDLYERMAKRLIYAESISQVNQYILSGTVDIGFTAKSIVTANELVGKGNWQELDLNYYNPIEQGVVILKFGEKKFPTECKNLITLLFSEKGKNILKNYGYLTNGL